MRGGVVPFPCPMLERAKQVIDEVAKQTDEIILFHSLSGKDSITLLDLCYPKFKRVVCVFMYIVKDLSHIEEYFRYAKMKYPNVEFIQVIFLSPTVRNGNISILPSEASAILSTRNVVGSEQYRESATL